jgi:hypothetical protein
MSSLLRKKRENPEKNRGIPRRSLSNPAVLSIMEAVSRLNGV